MRYEIDWIPTERIMAAAKAAGMPDDDDSPLDYVEPEDHRLCKVASSFDLAVAIAKEKLAVDFFGCTRIERMVKVTSRIEADRWEAEAVWHVWSKGDEVLLESEPHERPDIMIFDFEEIVDAA